MTLAEFIVSDLDRILGEWDAFASTLLPAARGLPPEALRDGAKALLLDIAKDLASPQSDKDQVAKSKGEHPASGARLTATAREHARHRLVQVFSLDQMVSEYRALRSSVLRVWTEQVGGIDHGRLDELIRFNEAIDQALTESIKWYSSKIEESRDLLLGVLGHDLRNPLGAARNSAYYLLRAAKLDGAQTKAVSRILYSADRMQKMVGDLLDFTHARLGRGLPLAPGAADLGEVCRQVVDELEAFHPERTLRYACEGALPGRWDAARVAQMLSNLLANAIQHGRPDAPVTVAVRGEADTVVVQVHNEGPPIAPEARSTLFEPMMRAVVQEAERREGASGLGLGLYIARQIAVSHGGSIEVASSEQDGTTFTARLPRKPPASNEHAGRPA